MVTVSEVPGWGVKLQTEVENLQETYAVHVKDNRDEHKELRIRTERPSRVDSVLQTLLSSVVVGLIVYVVTH